MYKILLIALLLSFAQKGRFEGITKTHAPYALDDVEMEEFLKIELTLIENMEKYVEAMQRKLNIINKATNEMMTENTFALLDAEKYLGNPLKSFSLIRRLHSDWKAWRDYLLKPVGEDFIKTMKQVIQKKPTHKDLKDAIEGLHTIQLIYDLQADDMAKGLLNGKQYDANLTMLDAFSIGKELHKMGFSVDGLGWLETAMRIEFDEQLYKRFFSLDAKTIFEDYKKIAEKSYLPHLPLKVIKSDAYKKLKKFQLNSHDDTRLSKFNSKLGPVFTGQKNLTMAFKHYSSMCRGNNFKKLSKMLCYKFPLKQVLLPFGVLKLELLHTDPNIMLYHDVIPDSMIPILTGIAQHHLEPAARGANAPTAKFYRLIDNKFYQEQIDKIMQRLTLVTGLSANDYEAPTIVNFGMNGHQSLDVDFFDNEANNNKCDLNVFNSSRQASVVVYLSDVVEGGATLFPTFNLAITPRKGSVLIWQNFYSNGMRHSKTMHSSCPVVVGSKWVMNLWIRQKKMQRNIAN